MSSKEELIQQLAELAAAYPERFERVKKRPEWQIVEREVDKLLLAERARKDSPGGFFAYYEGKYGFPPPWQVKKWITEIYEAHDKGLGYTINAYRGSWKSVSISVNFTEFRIGHEPHKTNLIVTAADGTANKITENITETIEFHPWWKTVFPNVVPDKGRWSSNGYWVIDTSMPREEWVAKQAGVIDPTLVGGGYTSTQINGKHPTGVAMTDDLHGLNNSHSETEKKAAVKFYTTEFSKTFIRKDNKLVTWPVNVGVPWDRVHDTHKVLSKSGGYASSSIPVMRRALETDEGAVFIDGKNEMTGVVYDDIIGWWILANPDNFGVDLIKQDRGLGKFDFWQMMMMDLDTASAGGLRYYSYPKDEIGKDWPAIGGCDPSYTFKERQEYEVKSSFFGVGVGLKRPRGGAVLADGILDQCNPNRAAGHIASLQSRFVNYLFTAVEDNGIGRIFIETVRLINSALVIITSDLGGIRPKGQKAGRMKDKVDRFRTEAAPFLENGLFFISDERNDYLDTVRDALDNFYELDSHKADKRLDALDTVYHILKAMPDVLQQIQVKDELPSVFKQKVEHPLAGRKLYGR
jgi:hypothetical protein